MARQTRRPNTQPSNNGALRHDTGAGIQDPSALTTQQLLRENFWLRELLEAELDGIKDRIVSNNEAVKLLQAFADRTPTTMDVKNDVAALREVAMEMFRGVGNQFLQNDKALTAALQAQEKQAIATNIYSDKAIAKSEAQTADAIRSLGILYDSANKATNAKVDDIKERITIVESKAGTVTEVRKDNRDNMGFIVGIIGLAIAAAVAFLKR